MLGLNRVWLVRGVLCLLLGFTASSYAGEEDNSGASILGHTLSNTKVCVFVRDINDIRSDETNENPTFVFRISQANNCMKTEGHDFNITPTGPGVFCETLGQLETGHKCGESYWGVSYDTTNHRRSGLVRTHWSGNKIDLVKPEDGSFSTVVSLCPGAALCGDNGRFLSYQADQTVYVMFNVANN